MDFPNDVATNVFRIDGIKEIGWAFYSRTYHDQAGLQEDLLDDDGADIEDSFHFAECILREKGKHVLLDEDDPGIWVFSLSKSEEDGVSQFLNSVGLSCSRSGLVQAVDLTGASRQDGPVEKHENIPKVPASLLRGSGEMNAHAFGMHIKSESQTMYHGMDIAQNHNRNSRQNITIIEIYPRMVAAISKSLSDSVADCEDFLRVGSYTFIESRTLGERLVEDLALHWTSAKTNTISLEVEWLSSGNLIISYSRGHMPRLCRVSHFLSENRRSGLSPEVPLLLSPSGATARFHGLEETPKTHALYRSIMEHKSSISARLARSGVLVPQDSSWLRVLVEQYSPGQDGKRLIHRPKNASITLWPACLCLCADPGAPGDDRPSDLIGNSIEHGSMDALASAESWLLGKAARLKALEVQRRKDELEIQKTKETQDTDDDDDLSDIELQTNPYNASQDVSGIYPTPPDGIPANILDSSPNNNPHSSGIDNEEDQGSTPGAVSRPYEEHGNEDIYGEMDIDMFASNGLTEADFSFFDEPGMNDGMLQEEANQIMVDDDLEGRIITNPAPATLSSDDNVVQSLQENQDGSAEQKLSAQDGEVFGEQEPIDVVRDAGLNKETGSQDLLREDTSEITDVEEETPDELGLDFEEFDDESSPRQRTSFDAVRFRGISKSFDRKYALRGRYAFDVDDLPMPSRPGEQVIRGEDILPQIGIARAKESSSEDDLDIDQTDGEPSTQSSDFPNEYDDADTKQQRQHQQSRKRKRDCSEEPDNALNPLSPASARETSAEGPETSLSLQTQALLFTGTENQIKERLAIETKSETPYMATFVGKDHTFIRIAQMVADQAVSGSDIYQTSLECISERDPEVAMGPDQHVESVTRKLSSSCSKISKRCTIKEYASLGDRDVGNVSLEQTIPQQKQRMPKPSYPMKPSPAAAQALFKLQAPYTCVRRTDTPMDISASALRFWEELSLAPAHGRKNVKAFCIFPANVDVSDDVTTFLNMIKGAYQSCNLGLHDLGAGLPDYINGLVHVPTGEQGDEGLLPDLNSACKLLGTRLGHLRLQGGNFVIYMVDSSMPNRTLPNLCAAFLIMFEAYNAALRESHIDDPNDMVLQILPSSLMFSIETIPMPAPAYYRKLTFDVYDRCGPNQNLVQKSQPRYLSAPAVCLAKAMPKAIDLKLTPESSAPRLQSDNCIHIAYAWTPGDHWLTAAWTDNHGILSWNSCYCFGEEDKTPWESFTDIAKEIWDTTLDMIQGHAPWRIFLCKDRPADRRELDAWQGILMDRNKGQISTTFLTLDTDPLLDFPAQESTNRIPELASGSLTTPGATPQSNAASPDISGFGTTPGGAAQVSTPPPSTAFTDHDADARLIDMTNETWGVLMNSPFETSSLLNTTYSDSCQALASAYLIKRAGPRDEDGLTRVAIKVLYGQTGHRAVLKEVLGMYAGLALLARARSMGNAEAGGPAKGVLPYHVAAARRAHAAVTATMRYGDG